MDLCCCQPVDNGLLARLFERKIALWNHKSQKSVDFMTEPRGRTHSLDTLHRIFGKVHLIWMTRVRSIECCSPGGWIFGFGKSEIKLGSHKMSWPTG